MSLGRSGPRNVYLYSHTAGPQLPSPAPDASSASSAPMSSAGWALKQQAKAKRLSQQVRSYLEELFKVGQQSGIKADHAQAARGMRQAVDDDGTRVFPPEDWLTAKQFQTYFSRLASANEHLGADEEEEDEQQQEAVQAQRTRRQLLDSLEDL